jgi:hypothetical protein
VDTRETVSKRSPNHGREHRDTETLGDTIYTGIQDDSGITSTGMSKAISTLHRYPRWFGYHQYRYVEGQIDTTPVSKMIRDHQHWYVQGQIDTTPVSKMIRVSTLHGIQDDSGITSTGMSKAIS